MDLLLDVGNSRVHLAAVEDGELVDTLATPHAEEDASWDEFWRWRPPGRIAAVSVRGTRLEAASAWCQGRFGVRPRVLGEDLPLNLPLHVDRPEQVGHDRLANALWAARTFPGRATLVVDLGTAVNAEVVTAEGAFVGGLIAPGLHTGAWALAERTQRRLPQVELREVPGPLGGDTESCLKAGLFYALVGLIETLCARVTEQLGARPQVVATGGDAPLIASACPAIDQVVPQLTLWGLLQALNEADAG